MRLTAALLAPSALAACVAPAPQGGAVPGEQRVTVEGAAFLAAVAPGAPGMMLTAAGVRPVAGNTVRVARDGTVLAMDEGALAKKAARAGCLAAGGRFFEQAIGRYDRAEAWVFPGACA